MVKEAEKQPEGFDIQKEALLKKRKRDDLSKKKSADNRARQKMAQVRQKKLDEKLALAGGVKVIMPEVFISNYNKQQRNYVKYKRFKAAEAPRHVPAAAQVEDKQVLMLPREQRVAANSLLLVVRIKESRTTTPQAQKILKELGLKEVNNCAFVRGSPEWMDKLLLIQNYVAWGNPAKATVEEIIRKRGYLKSKDTKRVPISDNVIVEELLGEKGLICIEDIIDALWRCARNRDAYEAVRGTLWPI